MRAFWLRMNPFEPPCADYIDAAIGPVIEPQYPDAADNQVPDNEMEISAYQFIGTFGPKPRR